MTQTSSQRHEGRENTARFLIDLALFAIKSMFVINAGAIGLALGLLGTETPIPVPVLGAAISYFVVGLILAGVCALLAYLTQYAGYMTWDPDWNGFDVWRKRYIASQIASVLVLAASLTMFAVGAITASDALIEPATQHLESEDQRPL